MNRALNAHPVTGLMSRHGSAGRILVVIAALVAAGIAAPILSVVLALFQESEGAGRHLFDTVLPTYILNTIILVLIVGLGVFVTGVSTAWLVTTCQFPGRKLFEWALVLPLAMPAYVIAYAYTDFLSHPGAVQSTLRDVTGWGPRDYWFPNIRSLEGAGMMFVLVLYPYVYLLARAAFLEQSVAAFEVARTLGRNSWSAFRRVALPMARPAVVTGVSLALMETLADFGTVAHFGVQTFTTGIYRAWFSMGDRIASAQLASGLLGIVLLLILVERLQRGRAKFGQQRGRYQSLPEFRLKGAKAVLASFVCAIPVLLGFVLPALVLMRLSLTGGHSLFGPRYLSFATNSLLLASISAILAMALALILAYAGRLSPGPVVRNANRVAALGYAIPGSVIAVGILIPLTSFDNGLDAWMRSTFNVSTGLLLTGSIFGLIYAYLVRFMAVALHTVDASLAKVPTSMDDAARTLGSGTVTTLRRVHMPIMRGGILTAGLIVFVDVMKELPATLIIRPFNFDTLAIQAYRLASDERLAQASTPALTIVAGGLIPVILLSREVMRSRPGAVQKGMVESGP